MALTKSHSQIGEWLHRTAWAAENNQELDGWDIASGSAIQAPYQDHDKFKSLMRRADTLQRIETEPIKSDWWTGYMRVCAAHITERISALNQSMNYGYPL